MKLLAAGGADISLKDRSGKSPLDLCDGDEVKDVLLKIQNGALRRTWGLSPLYWGADGAESCAAGVDALRVPCARPCSAEAFPLMIAHSSCTPPRSLCFAFPQPKSPRRRRSAVSRWRRRSAFSRPRRLAARRGDCSATPAPCRRNTSATQFLLPWNPLAPRITAYTSSPPSPQAEKDAREAEEQMKKRAAEEAAEEAALIAEAEAAEKAALDDNFIEEDSEPTSPSQIPFTPAERAARSETLKVLRQEAATAAKSKANKWKEEREMKRKEAEASMTLKKEEMLRLTKEESEIKKLLEEEKKRKKEEDARIKAEAVAAIIAAVKEPELAVDEAKEGQYSYAQIKEWSAAEQMREKGIRANRRESYLSDADFHQAFGAPATEADPQTALRLSPTTRVPPALVYARSSYLVASARSVNFFSHSADVHTPPLCALVPSPPPGITKDEFYNQAKWKQDKQKKEKGLF